MSLYGIKIHDRSNPEDPDLATVMYSPYGNPEGPWSDIATCDRDWAWEILNALQTQTATEDGATTEHIKHLENVISELVPYMVLDVYNGLFLQPTSDHDDSCQDCNWFKESKEWETRIRSNEFGNEAVDLLDRLQKKSRTVLS
jgi:hypothetical protein